MRLVYVGTSVGIMNVSAREGWQEGTNCKCRVCTDLKGESCLINFMEAWHELVQFKPLAVKCLCNEKFSFSLNPVKKKKCCSF